VIDALGVEPAEADSDELLAASIREALRRLQPARAEAVTVEASRGVVRVSGGVASPDEAAAIDRIVWSMFGVAEVRNALQWPAADSAAGQDVHLPVSPRRRKETPRRRSWQTRGGEKGHGG
jgi:hypothetical protein